MVGSEDVNHEAESGTSPAPLRRLFSALETALRWLCEIPAAILAGVEICLLFVGVIARYVFDSPIVWSSELASMLFLWLAMLGAVIAFQRGEHMRMTAIVYGSRPNISAFLEVLSVTFASAFMMMILGPSYVFAIHESIMTMPALGISNSWRAAAVPAGITLMTLSALLRLARYGSMRLVLASIVLVAVLGAMLYVLSPFLQLLGNYNLILFFVLLLGVSILLGIPIAFSFGLAAFSYLSFTTYTPLVVVVGRLDRGMSHIILLAIPLFVFLGKLIEMTGMAKAMVDFLARLLGGMRGGLSYVLVAAMYLVSGISGSKAADMAAIAPALFPEMEKRGAKRGDLVALLSATGAQTETIPPSIVLITIGAVTGVSITALFTGGLLPGLLLGIMLCAVVFYRHRNTEAVQASGDEGRAIGKSFVIALPALFLPVLIRAAVIEGIATPTEVSTVGIVYTIVVGLLVYRRFNWSRIGPMLIETSSLSGAILFIIGTATAMAWALTQSGFSQDLAAMMTNLPGGKLSFMTISILAFFVLGSVLEGIPAVVLFGPLLFPIARDVGVNEIHYAIVAVLSMGLGLFAPPFGVGYYAACAIGGADPGIAIRPIWGYLAALLVGIALIAAVPWISTGFLG